MKLFQSSWLVTEILRSADNKLTKKGLGLSVCISAEILSICFVHGNMITCQISANHLTWNDPYATLTLHMKNTERYNNQGKSNLNFPCYFCDSDGEWFRSWEFIMVFTLVSVVSELIFQVCYCLLRSAGSTLSAWRFLFATLQYSISKFLSHNTHYTCHNTWYLIRYLISCS